MKSSMDWNMLYKDQGKEQSSRVFNFMWFICFGKKKKKEFILNTINTKYCWLPDSKAEYLVALLFSSSISSSSKFGETILRF